MLRRGFLVGGSSSGASFCVASSSKRETTGLFVGLALAPTEPALDELPLDELPDPPTRRGGTRFATGLRMLDLTLCDPWSSFLSSSSWAATSFKRFSSAKCCTFIACCGSPSTPATLAKQVRVNSQSRWVKRRRLVRGVTPCSNTSKPCSLWNKLRASSSWKSACDMVTYYAPTPQPALVLGTSTSTRY